MSYYAQKWAAALPVATARDRTKKLVLMLLAFHANKKNECWVGIKLLMQETALTRNGVQKALQAAAKAGQLTVTERSFDSGRRRSNLYHLPAPIPQQPERERVIALDESHGRWSDMDDDDPPLH